MLLQGIAYGSQLQTAHYFVCTLPETTSPDHQLCISISLLVQALWSLRLALAFHITISENSY